MIHYFNPGHETAILNASKYYMAPANVVNMQQELAYLPAWYANSNDFVLVNQPLPDKFTSFINENFINQPIAVTIEDIKADKYNLKNQEVCLWGISPQAIHLFESINQNHEANLQLPLWNDQYKELTSRKTAHTCLKYITDTLPYISDKVIPLLFYSLEEIETYIAQNSNINFLAKAPFSSSGRGLLWLPKGELPQSERQILHGHLKKQSCISLEKALNKKTDFALEFYITNKNIDFKGISLFQTNEKGAYIGNILDSQQNLEKQISHYINLSQINEVKEILISFFEDNIPSFYNGYIGVDMLIYEEYENYFLHPCIEINLRNNMGVLAINLSNRIIDENSRGILKIEFNSKPKETFQKHEELEKNHPITFINNKIKSGYLSLCPVMENNKYNAYILVEG